MAPLLFLDVVDVELRVDRIGEKSLRYLFEVRKGTIVAARGEVTVAHVARGAKSASPWPTHIRKLLGESGKQQQA
jgi:acyl-CoA thioesterase FadM